ncbi:MAG: translation initiation factor IF-6 [Promethearchaeota archaeon]
MAILKAQVFGKSLIGVYLSANNSFILYPPNLLKISYNKFVKTFGEPFYPLTINNSNLLGVYVASNKYGIILPQIIRDDELKSLKTHLDDGITIKTIKSVDNAFGNLILCNDKGAIISSLLKDFKKKIEDILNVETLVYEFAGSYLPGSLSLANNNGCVVSPLTNDDEIDMITSVLKVKETDVSSINRGIQYLSAGAIVNDRSGIFGVESTGPELSRITSILEL